MLTEITTKDSDFLSDGKKKAKELLDYDDVAAFIVITVNKDNEPSYHFSQTGNRKLSLFGAMQTVLNKLIHKEYCED